jgi:hypothetical protein
VRPAMPPPTTRIRRLPNVTEAASSIAAACLRCAHTANGLVDTGRSPSQGRRHGPAVRARGPCSNVVQPGRLVPVAEPPALDASLCTNGPKAFRARRPALRSPRDQRRASWSRGSRDHAGARIRARSPRRR